MIRVTLAIVGLACIAGGCTTADVGYRPDTTLKTADDVYFQCRIAAVQNVPVNTVIETSPTYTTPIETVCENGVCKTTGGDVSGGGTTSYDANDGLRTQFFDRCVAGKGFSTVRLPKCKDRELPADYRPSLTDQLNPPGDKACYYRVTDNVSQIINPQ